MKDFFPNRSLISRFAYLFFNFPDYTYLFPIQYHKYRVIALQFILTASFISSFAHPSQQEKTADSLSVINKAFIEKIITVPPGGIGVVSDRVLTEVNDYILNLTGYSRDELIGQSTRIFYPSDEEYSRVGHEIQRQIQHNKTVTIDAKWQHKSGDIIYVMLAYVAADPDDSPGIVFFTVLDVTESRLAGYALEKRSRMFLVGLIVFVIILALLIFILSSALHRRKKAEKELQAKSQELELFFSSALDLLCIADTNGNFIRVNKEWERVLGYSTAELQKGKFFDYVHPDDIQATLDAIASLSEQKEVLNFINRYRCKDGSYRYIEWRSSPHGELIYAAARDITKSKEEKERLLKTQFAMDRARDSILWVGDDGSLVYANDSACSSMGYTREELLKMKVFDIDPDFPVENWEQHKKDMRKLGSMSFESRHCAKDGHFIPVEVSTNYFNYDDKYLACAFDRDITDRKKVEGELRKAEQQYRALVENS
ncbi:MAG: PAS domain S-box protein, partial [Bacteroidales bacterium]|nr:PAS domain S-box protein [Bacteroidales bacterium]